MNNTVSHPLSAKVALLEAQVKRLEDVLKPFADHYTDWEQAGHEADSILVMPMVGNPPKNLPLTVGHLQAAKSVIDGANQLRDYRSRAMDQIRSGSSVEDIELDHSLFDI